MCRVYKWRLGAVFAVLCMTSAAVSAVGGQKISCSASLRVMTYNIRYSDGDRKSKDRNWEVRKSDLADLVARENPDVVGFQEVLPEQKAFLEGRFPGYVFVGEFRNADRKSGEASPIAYRKDRFDAVDSGTFWLSETPDVPGSQSWGAMFPRICSWAVLMDKVSGSRFAFANAHTDHKSELAREKGMLLAIERMKMFGNGCPIVFTGDHNCLEYEKPALAVSEILKDAMYLSETQPEGPWRTANGWRWCDRETTIAEAMKKPVKERNFIAGGRRANRIDYIYVSPDTRVLSYRTIAEPRPGTRLYPSDHFPSVATIEFRKRNDGSGIMPESAHFAEQKMFRAVSPDGLNELRLEVGEKGMEYSVWRRDKPPSR